MGVLLLNKSSLSFWSSEESRAAQDKIREESFV